MARFPCRRWGWQAPLMAVLLVLAGCDEPAPVDVWPGLLEADLVDVAAEVPGRLSAVSVGEGQAVAAGAPLFRLSAEAAEATLAEARARVTEAEARLAEARDQVQRPADVAVLEAARDRAATALDLSRRELARVRPLAAQGVAPQARLDAAQAAFERDRAALAEADRRVEAAREPARDTQIRAAEAALAAARAQVRRAESAVADHAVAAPVAGRVERLWYEAGEVVPQGRPVLSLLPADSLEVRFQVPEAARAGLRLGQRVGLTCDGCADGLAAEITFIAADAEFTSPMMLAREHRHALAYRVEARPLGGFDGLTAGQPVSVHVGEGFGHGG